MLFRKVAVLAFRLTLGREVENGKKNEGTKKRRKVDNKRDGKR